MQYYSYLCTQNLKKHIEFMRKTILMSAVFMCAVASAQLPTRIETFPISSVRLGDSQFLRNQQSDIYYLLGLDADRLLAPYRKGAGLEDCKAISHKVKSTSGRLIIVGHS